MLKYLTFVLLFITFSVHAEYSIKGTIESNHDYSWIILYKIEKGKQVYVEKAAVTNGKFKFDLTKGASIGIYRAYYQMEGNLYVEFIFNNENLDFTFDPERPHETIEFISSDENQIFQNYLKSIEEYQKQIDVLQIEFFKATDDDQAIKIQNEYKERLSKVKSIQNEYEKISEGKLVYNFIRASAKYNANVPFKDPQEFLDSVKSHFFDAIDFNDKVLSNATFINDRLLDYVFYLTQADNQEARNILQKQAIDDILIRLDNNLEVLSHFEDSILFNYLQMENKEMTDYIIENYYSKLPKEYKDGALLFRIKSAMKTAIGVAASDFVWEENGVSKNLYGMIGHDYYMVVFFSSGCPHCKQEIPEFHEFIKQFKSIKILAIGLEDVDEDWKVMVKNYTGFTNILDLKKWDSEKVKDYGITAIPSYFLLDANKKIIAKPNDLEELKEMFEKK